jgi:hypothetical protein
MFRHFVAILPIVLAFALIPYANASISPNFNVFLSQYLNQSAITNATFYNQSVGSYSYIIMELSNGQIIVVNSTHGFSVVLNTSTAYSALHPYLLEKYYPNSTITAQLNRDLSSFQRTSNPPLNDCLVETGLSTATCTIANACYSCLTVPNCNDAMLQTGGPTGVLGTAIVNFSQSYKQLNYSYSAYRAAVSNITVNNTYQDLLVLQDAIQNISAASSTMPHNPLFPLPQGFNPSTLAGCPAVPIPSSPWYCKSLGYCEYLNFNSTALYDMQAIVTNLLSKPVSNASIMAYAINSTIAAKAFVQPIEVKAMISVLAEFYPEYNTTVLNVASLLASFHNTSLSAQLAKLQNTFGMLQSYNLKMNASQYNKTLSAEFSNLSSEYASLNSKYSVLRSDVRNTTAIVLSKELDYQIEPPKLAAVAYLQQRLNSRIVSGINSSQYSNISSTLQQIRSQVNGIGTPISMPALVKSVDGGIITGIIAGSTQSIPSKEAAAPLYAAIISLIIAIVLIIAFYFMTFHRFSKKQRLHLTHGAKRAWIFLFVILALLGGAYTYMTYAYAASANSFLPVGGFASQVAAKGSIAIAYNGTAASSNSSIVQCTSALSQTLKSYFNKSVSTIVLRNYSCISSSNPDYSSPYCLNQLLANGTPVVVVGQSQNSSIVYKGMYGYIGYASGVAVEGNACYLNSIFQVH